MYCGLLALEISFQSLWRSPPFSLRSEFPQPQSPSVLRIDQNPLRLPSSKTGKRRGKSRSWVLILPLTSCLLSLTLPIPQCCLSRFSASLSGPTPKRPPDCHLFCLLHLHSLLPTPPKPPSLLAGLQLLLSPAHSPSPHCNLSGLFRIESDTSLALPKALKRKSNSLL